MTCFHHKRAAIDRYILRPVEESHIVPLLVLDHERSNEVNREQKKAEFDVAMCTSHSTFSAWGGQNYIY